VIVEPVNVDYFDDRTLKATPEYTLFIQASIRNTSQFSLCELFLLSFCFTFLSPYFKKRIKTQVSTSRG
jgi:hypothetical protein